MRDTRPTGELLDVAAAAVAGFRPAAVERMAARPGKADVYRVVDGSGGRSLVLKLQQVRACQLEAYAYRVVGDLSIKSVTCHAVVPAKRPGSAWLVTENVGGDAFDPATPAHAISLARWLAALHVGSRRVADPTALPDHGSGHWLRTVAAARGTVASGIGNPAVEEPNRIGLRALEQILIQTLDGWDDVAACLQSMPPCLTHGDLAPQNIRMDDAGLTNGDPPAPMVLDWGTAGWGSPAIDLVWVDAAAYARQRRQLEPASAAMDMRQLRAVGAVLWVSYVLAGDEVNLVSNWPNRAASKAAHYVTLLATRGATRRALVPS